MKWRVVHHRKYLRRRKQIKKLNQSTIQALPPLAAAMGVDMLAEFFLASLKGKSSMLRLLVSLIEVLSYAPL
jgi:hypothetical protein